MKQGSEMSRLVLMGGSTPLQPFKTGCDASADVPAVFTRSSLNGGVQLCALPTRQPALPVQCPTLQLLGLDTHNCTMRHTPWSHARCCASATLSLTPLEVRCLLTGALAFQADPRSVPGRLCTRSVRRGNGKGEAPTQGHPGCQDSS